MEIVGTIRKLDNLGRVVIPVEHRKMIGVTEGSDVEICQLADGSILIRTPRRKCSLCPNTQADSHIEVADGRLCPRCVSKVRAL